MPPGIGCPPAPSLTAATQRGDLRAGPAALPHRQPTCSRPRPDRRGPALSRRRMAVPSHARCAPGRHRRHCHVRRLWSARPRSPPGSTRRNCAKFLPGLPDRGGRARSAVSRGTSPSTWGTACWPTSAGPRRTRTPPSGRSMPASPSRLAPRAHNSSRRPVGIAPAPSWSASSIGTRRGPGSGRWSASTPNLAARLQALAEPGAVVVAEVRAASWAACSPSRDLGAMTPRVSRSRCAPSPSPARARPRAVPRPVHAAVAAFTRWWGGNRTRAPCSTAGSGRRRARARWSCSRASGIGKSRLVRALRERPRRRGAHPARPSSAPPTTSTLHSTRWSACSNGRRARSGRIRLRAALRAPEPSGAPWACVQPAFSSFRSARCSRAGAADVACRPPPQLRRSPEASQRVQAWPSRSTAIRS